LSYITWKFSSNDKKAHSAEIYFAISGLVSVDNRSQQVVWESSTTGNLQLLKIGSKEQPLLQKSGDDLRIDWGYLYAAAEKGDGVTYFAGRRDDAIGAFTE
jgi:hypothetical protein